MKKVFLFFIILFLVSCTSESKYEKLISQHVQTDKHGTWTDVQFKVVNIEELSPIKVSDSIQILKQEYESNKADLLKKTESYLNQWRDNLQREQSARFKLPSIIATYTRYVEEAERRLDSLKHTEFTDTYKGISSEKVLLLPVKCRYSYVFPAGNSRQERTDVFYFISDKSKIIKSKQIKE